MAREKVIYEEKYKKPGMEVERDMLPSLNNLSDGFSVASASIMKRGKVERGGKEFEFLEMRIYLNIPEAEGK